MSNNIPPVPGFAPTPSEDEISNAEVNALVALLDYIDPEVSTISNTAALLLRLARRALKETIDLH